MRRLSSGVRAGTGRVPGEFEGQEGKLRALTPAQCQLLTSWKQRNRRGKAFTRSTTSWNFTLSAACQRMR